MQGKILASALAYILVCFLLDEGLVVLSHASERHAHVGEPPSWKRGCTKTNRRERVLSVLEYRTDRKSTYAVVIAVATHNSHIEVETVGPI